jgi:DNA (cytosine-5)-methyltransferase 1
MVVVGLFAGIGGFEAGLSRVGYESTLLCEIEPSAQAVLAARFPTVALHGDVRTLKSLPRHVGLLCAGFPCQDLSQAGRTAGIIGRSSSLVGEIFRLLSRHPVPWIVLENVPFMLQLARGDAMAAVVTELEDLGYRWAYRVVNAMAFGLPQRRERVYIVASRIGDPGAVLFADDAEFRLPVTSIGRLAHGFYWTEGIRGLGWAVDAVPTLKNGSTLGIPSPPAILMPSGKIVTPDIQDAERLQGFPSNWTEPAASIRRASFRWSLVGSAVSVPVAKWLGTRLKEPGSWSERTTRELAAKRWPPAATKIGSRVVEVMVSKYPVALPAPHLHTFLKHPGDLLSARATSGFLARAQTSRLRFPEGFLEAVRKHLKGVRLSDASELAAAE